MARTSRKSTQGAGGQPLTSGRRIILGLMGLCLVAMFVASFAYRVENPSLKVEGRASQRTQPGSAMGGESSMAMIRELMAKVEAEPENVEALTSLGEFMLTAGMLDRSITYLERARKIAPKSVPVLERLGIAYFQNEKPNEALEVFKTIAGLEPNNGLAHFNIGFVSRHNLGNETEAMAHFRKVLELPGVDDEIRRLAQEEIDKKPQGGAHLGSEGKGGQ